MQRELRLFLTALGFMTRIPCLNWVEYHASDLNHAARYFPLVGVVVGGVAALTFWLAAYVLPPHLAVMMSMAATILLTGAFHEDGLADTADGLGGGWDKEQILTIMKDSRIGSYGTVALIMALVMKFETLTSIRPTLMFGVLISGHALSRLGAVLVIYCQTYVRDSGKAKPLAENITLGELAFAAVCGLIPLAYLPLHFWVALIPVMVVWWVFSRQLKRQLGGYTGDALGAMQQLCELAFYLGIVACSAI